MTEFQRRIKQLQNQRKERLDVLFSAYGKTITKADLKKWDAEGRKGHPNKILMKHGEAISVIHEIFDYYLDEKMTKRRSSELIANVIEEHFNNLIKQ